VDLHKKVNQTQGFVSGWTNSAFKKKKYIFGLKIEWIARNNFLSFILEPTHLNYH
jgi:hypothetical protein